MSEPLHSLRWLIGKLTKRNEVLRVGSFVIPGSPVGLINICEDTKLTISIENVGKTIAYFKS